jgi:hypothetical protein
MAELVGTAEIRVDMATQAAVRSLQRMVARTDGPLRQLKQRISDVRSELRQLRGTSVAVTVDDRTGPGIAAVRAAVRDIESLGPVRIRAMVDDQTGPGVAAVRASVRDLERLGPARIRAMVDDETGPGAAAVRTAVRDLERLGPVNITARIDVHATDIAAATTALRNLKDAADDASRALRTLSMRAAAAAAALGVLSVQARALRIQLHDLDGALRNVGSGMGGLRGRLGTLSTSAGNAESSTSSLVAALIGLASAAIPVAAAVVPIAASLGAATIALGAFGGAVAGQIVSLAELKEAEDKAADAAANHGAGSKQAAEAQRGYQGVLDSLPPATRRAAIAFGLLTEQYQDWSDALAKDTMPVVTKSMAVFGALLPRLTPLVRGTSTELDRMMSVLGGIVQSDAVGRLSQSFAEFASGAISRATTRLANFAQTANTGQIGDNYREFMAYVRANGPLVSSTLRELGQAAVRIVVGFSDLGVSVLTVVNALASLVNTIPSGALSTFIQMYAALKLLRLGMAGVAAVLASGLVANMRAFTRAAVSGGVASALQGVAQRMTMMQKAALGLGVLAVAAVGIGELAKRARGAPPDVDRLNTSLKELVNTGKSTGEFRQTFGDVDGLVKKIKQLGVETKKAQDAAGAGTGFHIPGLDDLAGKISGAVNDMVKGKDSLNALKDDFKSLDAALAGLATSGHADTAADAFNQIKTAARQQGVSVKELNRLFPEYREAVAALKAEQALVAASMGLFGQQAQDTSAKLKEQKASADGLRQAIVALNDVNRSALGGMIGFEASIDAASKAARENAGSLRMVNGQLDVNSPKAQAAATALNDLAAKTDDAAGAARDNGRSWATVNGIYDRGRQKLIESAMQMGLTRKEAQALAAQILKTPDKTARLKGNMEDLQQKVDKAKREIKSVPPSKRSRFWGRIADLEKKVRDAKARIKSVPPSKRSELRATISQLEAQVRKAKASIGSVRGKTVFITAIRRGFDMSSGPLRVGRPRAQGGPIGYAGGGGIRGYPHGGPVRGPGTETSDSIPIMASRGEFMIRAAAVRRYGSGLFEALNSMRVPAHMGPGGATSSGTTAGRQMVQGLIDGMQSQLGALRSAVRDVGQEMADGLVASRPKVAAAAKSVASSAAASASAGAARSGAGGTARSTGGGGAKARTAQPKGGMEAAVAELRSLVLSGRWLKKKSMLFEDMHFLGMSRNYEKHGQTVADRFWSAVQQVKKATAAGKPVSSGMTFRGMSGNVKKFADIIAAIWPRGPRGVNFGDFGRFARGGLIRGGGTGSSDSVPILASRGEYMVRQAAVRQYGPEFFDQLNSMRVRPGAVGSTVPRARSAVSPTVTYNVTVENHGVLGSQMEVQNWLAKSLDTMARTGRLPAAVGGR